MSDFIDRMRENAERDASLEEMKRKYATGRIMEAAKRRVAAGAHPDDPLLLSSSARHRSHSEACSGCIASLTTSTISPLKESSSVSSLNLAEKISRVFLASYLAR
jgi:hypothetical protein